MQALLNLDASTVSYLDNPATSNPLLRPVSLQTSILGIPVNNPTTQGFQVPAYGSLTIFNAAESTSIDNTTTFAITLSPLAISRYRIASTGGTSPAFRTDRGLGLSAGTVALVALGNNSVTLTTTVSSGLSAIQLGDTILLPGPVTGDPATPFSPLNQGAWTVIGLNSGTSITMTRPVGVDYSAVSETQTPTSNAQVLGFSASGVQVGDSVDLNLGAFPQVFGTFEVAAVAPLYIEITSTLPLPLLTGVMPTATGMQFFNASKQYIELYADQSCHVQLNANTTTSDRIDPWNAGTGNINDYGFLKKGGLTYKVVVVNRTAQPLNLLLASVE